MEAQAPRGRNSTATEHSTKFLESYLKPCMAKRGDTQHSLGQPDLNHGTNEIHLWNIRHIILVYAFSINHKFPPVPSKAQRLIDPTT
jgi:hypothetical protein